MVGNREGRKGREGKIMNGYREGLEGERKDGKGKVG